MISSKAGLFVTKAFTTTVLLAVIFSLASPRSVATVVAGSKLEYILAAWIAFVAVHCVTAWKLCRLMATWGVRLNVADTVKVDLAALFQTALRPIGQSTSSFARWDRLSAAGGKRHQALAALVLNRLAGLVALAAIGSGAWAIDSAPGRPEWLGWLFACLLAGACIVFLLATSKRGLTAVGAFSLWLGDRWPALDARLQNGVRALKLAQHLGPWQRAESIALALLKNLLTVITMAFFCHAVGVEVSLPTIAWVKATVSLILILPISIAGLGVRELTFLLLLQPYGVDAASAVALALLTLSAHVLMTLLGGAIELRGQARTAQGATSLATRENKSGTLE